MPRLRTNKLFHTIYLVIIAVLVTLLVVERQDRHDTFPLSQQAWQEERERAQRALEETLNDLQDSLEADLAAIRGSVERLTPADDAYPRTRPASAEQPPLNALSENGTPDIATGDDQPADHANNNPVNQGAAPHPRDDTDAAHLNAADTDNFNTRRELFELQSVDPDWAYPTRERIERLFAQDAYLRKLQLIEVDCRSRICRIDLGESDPLAIDPARLLQALSGLNEDSEPAQFQLSSQPQEFGHRIYIERDD